MPRGRPNKMLEYTPNWGLYQGSAIRMLREEKGLGLRELAELISYHPGALSNVENNRAAASSETLKKIAEALDVKAEILKQMPLHPRLYSKKEGTEVTASGEISKLLHEILDQLQEIEIKITRLSQETKGISGSSAGSSLVPNTPKSSLLIVIDGPVATGKSVVGREVARRLGFKFLDTGMMYRAITWLALRLGINDRAEEDLARLAKKISLFLESEPDRLTILGDKVGPESITRLWELPLASLGQQEIRSEIDKHVSLVARVPAVRDALLAQQRRIAEEDRVVMVGRDVGTIVVPDAPLKIYLQASPKERARRRWRELRQQGIKIDKKLVLDQLILRDKMDSERVHSPLRPAKDAILINTDGLSIDQVVEEILGLPLVKQWIKKGSVGSTSIPKHD